MTCEPGKSTLSPELLDRSSRHDPSPVSTPEAVSAGPWHVKRHGREYAVVGADGESEAVFKFRETALLLAAVLPGCGRGQLYWFEPPEAEGRPASLRTVMGARGMACVGRLRHCNEEVLVPLSTAEYFLRSPVALSYLLEAASPEVLRLAEAELLRRLAAEPSDEPGQEAEPC